MDNAGIRPNIKYTTKDDYAILAMVEQGLGISLMSAMMLQGFNRRILCLPLDPPGWRDLGIACRNRSVLSGAASMFYEHACRWVRDNY